MGQQSQPLSIFPQRRTHQHIGLERIVCGLTLDEHLMHRAGRQTVGEPRSYEAAGTNTNVNAAVGEVETAQDLIERNQRADLIDCAQRAAAGQSDASCRMRHIVPPLLSGRTILSASFARGLLMQYAAVSA